MIQCFLVILDDSTCKVLPVITVKQRGKNQSKVVSNYSGAFSNHTSYINNAAMSYRSHSHTDNDVVNEGHLINLSFPKNLLNNPRSIFGTLHYQTVWMCRQTWLYTDGKDKSLSILAG